MTQRERSILIATTAVVLALAAVLVAVRALGPEGDAVALGDEGGQFISNDGDNSLVSGPDSSGDEGLAGDEARSVAGDLAPPASSDTADTTGDASNADSASGSTTATTAAVATTTPTIAPTSTVDTTAAPTTATSSPETTAAETTTTAAPTSVATTGASGLQAIEVELLSLTNQLRANPSGALARRKPMPECVQNAFYGITIDGATGHPSAVPALTLDEAVSVQLARDWSAQMDQSNQLAHRSNAAASAIYSRLGINWSATGENIAWFSGYPDAQAAQIFFEGWRESDSGHYCALVAGAFTHVGVGYHKGAQKSWATQNFYRLR